LQQWGFTVIDCQILNAHLLSMGAEQIPRSEYLSLLNNHINLSLPCWQADNTVDLSRWQP
jgi:leucyl/phenylalanyl-tRNA--protein transferase